MHISVVVYTKNLNLAAHWSCNTTDSSLNNYCCTGQHHRQLPIEVQSDDTGQQPSTRGPRVFKEIITVRGMQIL